MRRLTMRRAERSSRGSKKERTGRKTRNETENERNAIVDDRRRSSEGGPSLVFPRLTPITHSGHEAVRHS